MMVAINKDNRRNRHLMTYQSQKLSYLIDHELVMLDDVASQVPTQWQKDMFFDFVDQRYNHPSKPTIITSNLSRNQFNEIYHYRVTSRIFSNENTILMFQAQI